MGGNAAARYRSTGTVKIFEGRLARAERIELGPSVEKSRAEIISLLRAIEKHAGEEIWGDKLEKGQVFFGSAKNVMSGEVSDEELLEFRPTLGDVDVVVRKDRKSVLHAALDSLEDRSVDSSWACVGSSSHSESTKRHTVFMRERTKSMVQFDFEAIDFVDEVPEIFLFMRSSPWPDARAGIKGVAHKFLLHCLVHEVSHRSDRVILTAKSPLSPPGKIRARCLDEIPPALSLSEKGLRTKLVEQKLHGISVFVDGKRAFKEVPRSESKFETNVAELFRIIFLRRPADANEMMQFWSFVGLLDLCSKLISRDRIHRVHDRMIRKKLWGGGQKLSRTSTIDLEIKTKVVDRMIDKFPYLSGRIDTAPMIAEYYSNFVEDEAETDE